MRSTSRSVRVHGTGLQPSGAAGRGGDFSVPGGQAVAPRRPKRIGRRRAAWIPLVLIALVLLAIGLSGNAPWHGRPADIRDGTTAVTPAGLAARYGIDVKLVAVTAAGGLVDFRYQVVDPDKANPIIHDVSLFPKVVVEDTGATLALRSLPHNHKTELELGGTYFFLLANANNAVHKGSKVTLVIGDARLEHVLVQG